MKKIQKIILLIASCLFYIQLPAQITGSKDFIYLPYGYRFCPENYSLSIPIPAGWGFQVPFLNQKDASLSICSDYVRYSVEPDSITNAISVMFALPDTKTPCLELRMTAFGSEQADRPGIKSEFGDFYTIDQPDEEKAESYQNFSDYKILTFRILAKDEKTKQICRDIIAACTPDYGRSSYSGDDLESHSIHYYAKDSTYYPVLGLTFVIPFDASAVIRAPRIKINDATTLLTASGSLDDFSGTTEAGVFKAPGFDMKYRFVKGGAAGAGINPNNLMNDYSEDSYAGFCTEEYDYAVNGIPSKIYTYGSKSMPTILVVIPVKTYSAVFLFSDVSAPDLQSVDDFLAQIHIDDAQKEGLFLVKNNQSLGQIIPIEEFGFKYRLPEISISKNTSVKGITMLKCIFPELKATLYIPYLPQVKVYPESEDGITQKKGMYTVSLKKEPLTEDNDRTFYSGLVSSSESKDYCLLWLPVNENHLTAEQYLYMRYASFECLTDHKISRLGTCNINGQKWYIMSAEISSSPIVTNYFITECMGEIIEMRVLKIDSDDLSKSGLSDMIESLLYKANFKH
ncbi:MAG: hypothetical protein FWF54_03025 [Candidatus Azobacteroides sp.]|nr:hypothetical protein [Candidatus Azobacteroides sp.]